MDRRNFFQGSALMSTGALLGCATPGIAQQKVKTPFDVPQVYIPVVGSDEMFPVRRIYCIGRNYAAHAREMGSDPTREPPFFFCKPADAVVPVPPIAPTASHPVERHFAKADYLAARVAAQIARETADREKGLLEARVSSRRDWEQAEAMHGDKARGEVRELQRFDVTLDERLV